MRVNELPTLASRTIELVSGKTTIYYTTNLTFIRERDAEEYLLNVGQNSFTCQVCNKRVKLNPRRTTFGWMAIMLASRMCSGCHFWMQKVWEPYYMIINGNSYTFSSPTHLNKDVTTKDLAEECLGYPDGMFIARNLKTGERLVERMNVWEQGKVDEACRMYLPDTHQWLCPMCFEPMIQFGHVCGLCEPIRASWEEKRLDDMADKREEQRDAYYRIMPDYPGWDAVLDEAWEENDEVNDYMALLVRGEEYENRMRAEATECTCTEDMCDEPPIDRCWYCQKMSMEQDARDQQERDDQAAAEEYNDSLNSEIGNDVDEIAANGGGE